MRLAGNSSEVRIAAMSEREIDWYARTGEGLDKAGAYAAQGIGAMFIDSIHGSYTNVVGLPLALLVRMLERAGIDPLASEANVTPSVSEGPGGAGGAMR